MCLDTSADPKMRTEHPLPVKGTAELSLQNLIIATKCALQVQEVRHNHLLRLPPDFGKYLPTLLLNQISRSLIAKE